ncbi:MAG: DNA-processing protein DprA [Acidimicrobiales bacterium]
MAPTLPPGAFAAALAALPGAGPAWLVQVLLGPSGPRCPELVWHDVLEGKLSPLSPRGRTAGSVGLGLAPVGDARTSGAPCGDMGRPSPQWPARIWQHCQSRGIKVTWTGGPSYPRMLAEGPAPPGVLFWVGDIGLLERPCVAVVGTRRCTADGLTIAYQLGYDLSSAGACVVSGLAAGIDGAAHAGALAALRQGSPGAGSTVGVAASGVDVPYPPKNRALWEDVSHLGAVLSEAAPGRPAQAWRFPSRNRVIAGLVRVVVIVESHLKGGSWHTVNAALDRGAEVAAVPGSVLSPASAGTNVLLREGAHLVRTAQDVLDIMGLAPSRLSLGPAQSPLGSEAEAGGARGPVERSVLGALGRRPRTVDEVVERSGLPLGAVLVALDALKERGAAVEQAGWWSGR